jgi:hypothetical protein
MLKKFLRLISLKRILIATSICACFYVYLLNLYSKSSDQKAKPRYFSFPTALVLKSACECLQHQEIILTRSSKKYTAYMSDKRTKLIHNLSVFNENELKNSRFTCGLYNVLRRGRNQRVLAYSLYGRKSRYYEKLVNISKQIKQFYPNSLMRIYHDNSINKSLMCEIECIEQMDIVDFCNINEMFMRFGDLTANKSFNGEYLHGMKWRFFPFGDDFVDTFSSRDTDSFILQREVDAVNEWLQSGLFAHLMRGF